VRWPGLPCHRSRLVRQYPKGQAGRRAVEWLHAYRPQLNPVEYVWGLWKNDELPNPCPQDPFALGRHAGSAWHRRPRRPTLVAALWKQAELFE